jgi:glucose/arabinose dehydrogenase
MRFSVILLLALSLVLSACSDSDTPEAQDSPGSGATAAPTVARSTDGQSATAPPVTRGNPGQPAAAAPRRAQPFDPNAFTLEFEQVARGFQTPTLVTYAPDGSGRLFVLEQAGRIRIIQNGQTVREPFLDITRLVRSGGEQGLLGLAFHPQYAQNGRFFVYYTAQNADNTIAEYRVTSDPNRAEPNAVQVLVAIPDFASNHNGGMLAFGPDGYLYAGTGDGGGGGDPRSNGQNTDALLGKLLRFDVNGGSPYGIPPDNPFVNGGGRAEVWAYGLRNPWRFSFDRATGDLWIADVGQNAWEEINLQPAGSPGGLNYGWNTMEGAHCFSPRSGCNQDGLVLPVAEYENSGQRGECSVTGGYVYRGQQHPQMVGAYYYADYCSGRVWALAQDANGAWTPTEIARVDARISSFGEDEAGEVYATGHGDGVIYRLKAAAR